MFLLEIYLFIFMIGVIFLTVSTKLYQKNCKIIQVKNPILSNKRKNMYLGISSLTFTKFNLVL